MALKLKVHRYSTPLLVVTTLLCFIGLIVLFSSALGKLTSVGSFTSIMVTQIIGVAIGYVVIFIAICGKKIDYRDLYKKHYSLYLFIAAVLFQLTVFTPIGIERKGALRWVDVGVTTLQPSEFLKIGLVLFLASLLIGFKKEVKKLLPLILILGSSAGVSGLLMLLIKDKGSLIIMGLACLAMLLVSRARLLHVLFLGGVTLTMLMSLIFFVSGESYAKDRILSFVGLTEAPQGQDYQINLAVATIGSGQVFGKGYGESIQKFSYLPETLNDSIFAVYAEEWGFVGSLVLIVLFILLAWYGLSVAQRATDEYGMYVAVGLVVLLVSQALFNMLAMVKLVPLSGMPLIFISKGGSAMLASLIMVAILLNISRFAKK